MSKARDLADFVSAGNPLADGTIDVAEVSGAAPLASPTFTGTVTVPGLTTSADVVFGDNDKAIFGAGSDLQIYHDPVNGSFISDQGVGSLNLLASTYTRIKDAAGTNTAAEFNPAGASAIYYANALKLATTSTGVDVTGDISIGDGSSSSTRFLMGTGDDSKMFHNGVDTYWINDTGNIIIRNQSDDKDILLQTDDGLGGTTTYITIDGSETDVSLHYGGSEKLATTSTGIDVTGTVVSDGLTAAGELIANSYNETYAAVTSTTNATTVNCEAGNTFMHTLTENTTFTFSNPPASGTAYTMTIEIIQDASASGFTVTWPASVDWPSATAPTLTATASAVDVFVFTTRDGGTTWYGFTAGLGLATPA